MTRRILLSFLAVFALLPPPVPAAQTVAELERQLAAAPADRRGLILATLTDALKSDNPKKAVGYGEEALALFAQHPDPVSQVKTLNELAWAYMTLGEYDRAVTHAQRGRELATAKSNDRGRARAINNLGVIAQRRGDARRAVELFQESLEIYKRLGLDLEVSNALNNLGFVYSTDLADYEKALGYHANALSLREKLGDKAATALSLNNIGIIYHRLGNLTRALDYFEQALRLRREIGAPNRIAGTLNNIGDVMFDQGQFETALDYHNQALQLRREIGDRSGVAMSLKNLGMVNTRLGHLDVARQQLTEALGLASAGDRTLAAAIHLGLAWLEREQGSAPRAVDHAKQALAIAQAAHARELVRQSWQELSASQEKIGDFAGALQSFKQFKDVADEILSAEKSRRLEALEGKYEAERRENEIQQLRAQQAIDALGLTQQKQQRNATIAAATVVTLVVLGFYLRRVDAAKIAQRLSVTDTLTGLRNRRYVTQTMEADAAISARKLRTAVPGEWPCDTDLVFFVIDVDEFKSINDRYGHAVGDRVLVEIASVLRGTIRTSDTVARWGGEEFLVICRFTNREAAAISAERLRATVQEHVFNAGRVGRLSLRVSIGFASYPFVRTAPDAFGWEEVIHLADQALYLGKQSGRNAWVGVEAIGPIPKQLASPGHLRQLMDEGLVHVTASRPLPGHNEPDRAGSDASDALPTSA